MVTLKAMATEMVNDWHTQATALSSPAQRSALAPSAYHVDLMIHWDEHKFRQGLMQMYQSLLVMELSPGVAEDLEEALDRIKTRVGKLIGASDAFSDDTSLPGMYP